MLVKLLVADRVVAPALRTTLKPTVPFALLFMLVQLPEIFVLAPGNGLALKAKEFTADGPILIAEEKVLPLEQVAFSVAGPVVRLFGIMTLLENVPVVLKFTVPKE